MTFSFFLPLAQNLFYSKSDRCFAGNNLKFKKPLWRTSSFGSGYGSIETVWSLVQALPKKKVGQRKSDFFLLLISTELEIILNSFRCFTDDFRLLKPTTSAVGFLNKVKGLN